MVLCQAELRALVIRNADQTRPGLDPRSEIAEFFSKVMPDAGHTTSRLRNPPVEVLCHAILSSVFACHFNTLYCVHLYCTLPLIEEMRITAVN
jgi:hypothetical protein